MRALWLADVLREWGLNVVEVAGWQTRGQDPDGYGRAFDPQVVVDHHTAGPRVGDLPTLGVLLAGRPDVPGPLCNVATPRNTPNTVYVMASGKSNNAGEGSWAGFSGNYHTLGNERENVGTDAEPFTFEQNETAARTGAALIDGIRRYHGHAISADRFAEHKEWAPTRKIDAWKVWGPAQRARIAQLLAVGPHPTPIDEEDDMDAASAIRTLYLTHLGREPDTEGMQGWMIHHAIVVAQGATTTASMFAIAQAIYDSDEAKAYRAKAA